MHAHSLEFILQLILCRHEHFAAYSLAHLICFGVNVDFLAVWLRPLKLKKRKTGKKRKHFPPTSKLVGNRYVLPQSVRNQLKERGEKIKMTSQINRPYECVVRYSPQLWASCCCYKKLSYLLGVIPGECMDHIKQCCPLIIPSPPTVPRFFHQEVGDAGMLSPGLGMRLLQLRQR